MIALLLAAVVLATCWATHPRLLRAAASWLDVGERPRKADYVMVLNGGEDSRPFAAAALVKAHWARRALVAETAPSPEVIDGIVPPYHEINRRVLLKRGVPAADVTILPGAAATTYDEAVALAAFLQRPAQRPRAGGDQRLSHAAKPLGVRPSAGRPRAAGVVRLGPERRIPDGSLVAKPSGAAVDRDGISQTRVLRRELRIPGLLAGGLRRIVLVARWIRRRESLCVRNR